MEKIIEIVRIKQMIEETPYEIKGIRSPEDASQVMFNFIGHEDREVFIVICLNTKNEVIAVHRAHVGSINASVVHPREVFKTAFLNNATSLIVGHNHPSGDPTPSQEDINVTKRLAEAGRILGVEILDSLIIGEMVSAHNIKHISLKERGYL